LAVTAVTAAATGESADFVAEATGPADLPHLTATSAPVSAGGGGCYCDQAVIDRGRQAHLAPSASVDPYAGTLARWFGVSNRELDAILRDL
jgi:uncharacterized protein (DUF1501 family)